MVIFFVSIVGSAQETVTDTTKHWTRKGVFTLLANQSSFYVANIRNKDDDPFKGQKLRIDPIEEPAAAAADSTAVDSTATAPAEQPQ